MQQLKQTWRQRPLLLIGAALAVTALLVLSQRALAEQAGALIAGLWVSIMDAVVRLVGAAFGG